MFLVLGLVFSLAAKKAMAVTMDDNVFGNAALAYWQAQKADTNPAQSTYISIVNTNKTQDRYVKYILRDECSSYVLDDCHKLTGGDVMHLKIHVEDGQVAVTDLELLPPSTVITTLTAGDDEARGYIEFTMWEGKGCTGANPNEMAVTTALVRGDNKGVGINAAMVQDWVDKDDDYKIDAAELPKNSIWWGRWYSDADTDLQGWLITVFPGLEKDPCESYILKGNSLDEKEDARSFYLKVKEVAKTPIGPGFGPSFIVVPPGATRGAIEIQNDLYPMFGFILMDDCKRVGAFPLFHNRLSTTGCPGNPVPIPFDRWGDFLK